MPDLAAVNGLRSIRKRRILRLAPGLGIVLAGLAIAPTAFGAKHMPGPVSRLDTATATGANLVVDDFSSTKIQVDAFSGPSGENPGGSVSFDAGGILPVSGPVSCLEVSGKTAVMTVQGPFPSAPGFLAFIVKVVDNGGSGLDRFEYWPVDPEVPDLNCHTGSPDYFGGLLIGRALVSDAAAVPTSKKQCRHGGYAKFGFKNRRRCIRYVTPHR